MLLAIPASEAWQGHVLGRLHEARAIGLLDREWAQVFASGKRRWITPSRSAWMSFRCASAGLDTSRTRASKECS
jgi:hypothetical protein